MPSELFKKWGIELPTLPAKPDRCVWKMDERCDGEVRPQKVFGQVVNVCQKHYDDHNQVLVLTNNHNYSVEKVLAMTSDERKALYYKHVL